MIALVSSTCAQTRGPGFTEPENYKKILGRFSYNFKALGEADHAGQFYCVVRARATSSRPRRRPVSPATEC